MSLYDYSAAIKVTFDRDIVVDPDIVNGIEEYPIRIAKTLISTSGDDANNTKDNITDNQLSTFWRAASATMPQYVLIETPAGGLTLTKVRVYLDQYKPSIYQMQGCNTFGLWIDIATGTFIDTIGWQDITFPQVNYKYWRLYITAKRDYYCQIYELQFLNTRTAYQTVGWEVSAQEPDMVPSKVMLKNIYRVRRITRTNDNRAVILWLDIADRMLYPYGDVTVKFTGTLVGAGNANVAPFELSFTPTSITKIFNPNDAEYVTAQTLVLIDVKEIGYRYGSLGIESITSLVGITVVVTKVGGLPL